MNYIIMIVIVIPILNLLPKSFIYLPFYFQILPITRSSKGALISPQPVSLGIKPQPKPRNTKYRIHNIDTTKIDYEGVTFFKPRGNYKASIRHNGKGHFLCYFRLAADAAFSHDEAAILFKDSNWTFNFATRDDYEHARALELKSTDYSIEEVGSVAEVAWKINKAVSRVFAVASTAVSEDSFIETDHIASDRNAEESDLAMENSASLVAYCQDKELLPPQYSFSTNEGEAYTTDNILIGTNVGKPTERNAPIKNEPG